MNRIQLRTALLFIIGLSMIGAALYLGHLQTPAANAQDGGDTPSTPEASGDNSYCLVCHQETDRTATLADGTILNLQFEANAEENFAHGIHTEAGLGCIDCHGEGSFPHDNITARSQMEYVLQYEPACLTCHGSDDPEPQLVFEDIGSSTALEGSVCADCHVTGDAWANAHPPDINNIDVATEECATCHESAVHEWEESAHGTQQLGCATCHLTAEREMRFGSVDNLCLNCHEENQVTYEHVVHEELACNDCHWDAQQNRAQHVLLNGEAMPSGHDLLVETQTCVNCHAQDETISLVAERTPSEEGIALETEEEIETLETELEELRDEEAGDSAVRLLQGLIVGLALGVILVTLGLRLVRMRRLNTEIDENEIDKMS